MIETVNNKFSNFCIRFCTLIFFALSFCTQGQAQVVLYLEIMTEERPIKYYEGQVVSLKTAEYPDDWQDIKIERFINDEGLIVYDGGYLRVEDITHIRRTRGWAQVIGTMLQTFGVAWIAYGGVIHFATDTYDFGVDTAVTGLGSYVSGWIIKKAFRHKKYKIGKKVRVKLLDISWPEPRG